MIYRELLFNSNDEEKILKIKKNISENLDDFLIKTKDMNYALPLTSMCFPGKKNFEKENKWSDSKGFFCSQLVAAAYLNMGIINYEKSTLRYFPGNFSQSSEMTLNDDFFLGPEIIIDFTK